MKNYKLINREYCRIMKYIRIGKHMWGITFQVRHTKLPKLKGILDGEKLVSKRKWKKQTKQ